MENPEIIKLEKGTSHMAGSPYYAIYEFKPLKKWKGNPKVLKGLVSNIETADCGIKLSGDQKFLFFIYAYWLKGYELTADKLGLISVCNSIALNNKALYSSTIKWLNE